MKASREDFAQAMLDLIASGRDPDTMTVGELCARFGVARASFYNYFRAEGGMEALREAALALWLDRRLASMPGSEVSVVRDPVERLRLLHAAAQANARQDVAMRRWAVSDQQAADAVAQADEKTGAYLTQALADLGFGPDESIAVASLLAAALSAAGRQGWLPPLARTDTWETVLAVLERAAAAAHGRRVAPGADDVRVMPGDAPDEFMLYLAARSLPASDRQQLNELARDLARRRVGDDEPGTAAADEAAQA
jgi:AcrR family transcriptional regulator